MCYKNPFVHFNNILKHVTFLFHWVTQFQCFPLLFFFYLCHHFHFQSFTSHYLCILSCERLMELSKFSCPGRLRTQSIFKHLFVDFESTMTICSRWCFYLWTSRHFHRSWGKIPNPLKSKSILSGSVGAIQFTAECRCLSLWGEALLCPCCSTKSRLEDHKPCKHVMIPQPLSCCEVSIARNTARAAWQTSSGANMWLHSSLPHTVEVQTLLSSCSVKSVDTCL